MTRSARAALLACVSGSALIAFAAPAPAQEDETARGPERIVVTAQRREQELSDVPLSVTNFSSERLESAQVHTLEDLQQIAPSIELGNDFNMAKVFIRGVGANTSTTGSETGVALHVDGAFVARAEAQLTSLFDVNRIEVVRGPQGTLYGRNAVGGSINVITNKPTDEPEGYVRASYGNYDAAWLEAAAGGPLNDKFLGRIAVRTERRDGFGENPVTGNDVDDLDRQMIRGHLLFRPADKWNVLLTGEAYTQDDASRAVKFRREAYPNLTRLRASGVGGYAADPRDLASEFDPRSQTDTWALTLHTDWDASDALTFTNISNYRKFDGFLAQDLDVSAVVNTLATTGQNSTIQRRDIRSEQWSTEFQGTLETDWLSGVLGVFVFDEVQNPTDTVDSGFATGQPQVLTTLQNPNIPIIVDGGAPVFGGFPVDTALAYCHTYDWVFPGGVTPAPKRVCVDTHLYTDVWAVFGQANVPLGNLTPALADFAIKVGARYSHEEVVASNPNVVVAANGLGPILVGSPEGTRNERHFNDITPEAGIQWTPTDDLLVYYRYAEGFKAGAGENAAPSATSPIPFVSTIVDPEEIESHEIGVRATLLDGLMDLAAAYYTYDLEGQQINKTISGGAAGFGTIFENAAQTSADGVELEVDYTPWDIFRLSAAVSWLDSTYDDFLTKDPLDPRNVQTPGPCPPPGSSDPPDTCFIPPPPGGSGLPDLTEIQLAGNRTRNAPEWSANLHAELDALEGDKAWGGVVTLMGDVTYKDDIYFTEFNRQRIAAGEQFLEGQKAYTILDFTVRWEDADRRWTADAWVKNATDELVASSTFALATARTIGVTWLPPRTYGVTLGYRF